MKVMEQELENYVEYEIIPDGELFPRCNKKEARRACNRKEHEDRDRKNNKRARPHKEHKNIKKAY